MRYHEYIVTVGMVVSNIYLPAVESYPTTENCFSEGVPIDEEINRYEKTLSHQNVLNFYISGMATLKRTRYVAQEFPHKSGACTVYSVPQQCIPRREQQASQAERIVFDHLKRLNIPGLWLVFFQGSSYGGRSSRRKSDSGRIMIREHDYVLFTFYNGVQRVTLIEVKSTSDTAEGGLVQSDARAIKNNKRTAQHQLRDHLDILSNDLGLAKITLDCHIFWPFLSSQTKDPQDNIITRWKDDGNLHAFRDIFQSEDSFREWFQNNILQSPSVFGDDTWKRILQRFIILSCGVFVDEIHQGMLALLSQEQVDLLSRCEFSERHPLIIHGAAGTGKTMLIIRKLQQLYEEGRLHEKARALFICYWPGIRSDVEQKLQALGIGQYVDTERFFISLPGFLNQHSQGYKHIFMDESEAICLAFDEKIITHTFQKIFYLYQQGNATSFGEEPGALWFMVDINQASLFLPKYSPNLLKTPDIILTKVIRSTKSIYSIFDRFYQEPLLKVPPAALKLPVYQKLQELSIGHNIAGPPIYWVNSNYKATCIDTLVSVVVDLCSTKGIKPNDLCVLPYLANNYELNKVNSIIGNHFVEGGFMPQAVNIVESFVLSRKANHFLIPWVLRVKGLEFKVVIMVIDDEDFDFQDAEDRRKVYIMASRCTCLLVLISPEAIRDMIDTKHEMKNYPFTLSL